MNLACDGSHIPFTKYAKKDANDYRNYKGWHSILTVAFVDSFYCFFDLHVGYPGRAGDNTVLKSYWLMKEIQKDPEKWLGPGGVILGDSGASCCTACAHLYGPFQDQVTIGTLTYVLRMVPHTCGDFN